MTDEEMLMAAARGDAEAFAAFYRRHVRAVTAFMHRRTADREVAFDLAAETFAAALAGASTFDSGRGSAAGWLWTIARNELHDARRAGQVADRARRRLQMQPIHLTDDTFTQIGALDMDVELQAALTGLPEDERIAVLRRILDEEDYATIARDLECSTAVVRQRVSRGLRRLRVLTAHSFSGDRS